MKALCVKVGAVLVSVALSAGCWGLLWWQAATRQDDAVREICIGSVAYPDWFLAEKQVEGAAYYTIYSRLGNTPWDTRFGDRPTGWLYGLSVSDTELMLQRTDGRTWVLNRATGGFREVPSPQEPLILLGLFFGDAQDAESAAGGNP